MLLERIKADKARRGEEEEQEEELIRKSVHKS
jgi:hypothetical protein